MIKVRRGTLRVPEYEPFADHLPRVPDLLQRLSWEHRQIEKLWRDLQRLHSHDGVRPQARLGNETETGIAQVLVQALAEHEAAERAVLYRAAARVMPPEWVEGATDEHAELRAMLDEVDGADPRDEAVFEVYERVMARMLAHFNEEDRIVFPVMRVSSPPDDLVNPEGYDFLGLPPGKTMIAVTPGQTRLAIGTGRRPNERQMALGAGGSQAQAAAEQEPTADGNGHAKSDPEIDIHEAAGNGNGKGTGEVDDSGAHGGEGAGATRTRPKRLLRRR